VVSGIIIYALTILARTSLSDLLSPAANLAFFLLAYGFFTMLWIQNMHLFLPFKAPKLKWLIVASALPMGFLVTVKLFSIFAGRDFRQRDVIIAAVGIAAVVITTYLIGLFRCRRTRVSADT
jgi:hypothetical protein